MEYTGPFRVPDKVSEIIRPFYDSMRESARLYYREYYDSVDVEHGLRRMSRLSRYYLNVSSPQF